MILITIVHGVYKPINFVFFFLSVMAENAIKRVFFAGEIRRNVSAIKSREKN
jgi:hypothetical protein